MANALFPVDLSNAIGITTKADKVAVGATVPEGVGRGKIFPPLDPGTFAPQLFWLALTFGLLYVLLKRWALPRVAEVLEERREVIARDLDQAEKLKDDTQRALTDYELTLAEARTTANAKVTRMHDELAREVDEARATMDALIAQKLAEAEERIAQSKAKAIAGVGEIASDTAGAIVARLIGKEVSKDDVRRALMQRSGGIEG